MAYNHGDQRSRVPSRRLTADDRASATSPNPRGHMTCVAARSRGVALKMLQITADPCIMTPMTSTATTAPTADDAASAERSLADAYDLYRQYLDVSRVNDPLRTLSTESSRPVRATSSLPLTFRHH